MRTSTLEASMWRSNQNNKASHFPSENDPFENDFQAGETLIDHIKQSSYDRENENDVLLMGKMISKPDPKNVYPCSDNYIKLEPLQNDENISEVNDDKNTPTYLKISNPEIKKNSIHAIHLPIMHQPRKKTNP